MSLSMNKMLVTAAEETFILALRAIANREPITAGDVEDAPAPKKAKKEAIENDESAPDIDEKPAKKAKKEVVEDAPDRTAVRAAFEKLMDAYGDDTEDADAAVEKILKKFGVDRLSKLDEDDFAAAITRAEAALEAKEAE